MIIVDLSEYIRGIILTFAGSNWKWVYDAYISIQMIDDNALTEG